jgi:hypothetical protein
MLIFRGTDWNTDLPPEQMQRVADPRMAWFNGLKEEGKCIAGDPVERDNKIVTRKSCVVSDSPFAESKETIDGSFRLDVGTTGEAVTIAQECPGLPYGIRDEVRPVAAECPIAEEMCAEAQMANA